MFEPLKITIKMKTALVIPDGVYLDATLSFFHFKNNPCPSIQYDGYDLPLRKIYFFNCTKNKKDYFWDCTKSIIVKDHTCQETLKKQVVVEGLKANVNIARGEYCSNIFSYEANQANLVTFYAYGDKNGIEDLLKDCTALGKLRKNGYGQIKEIIVEKSNFETSIFQNNLLLKSVPVAQNFISKCIKEKSFNLTLKNIRVRPPYNQEFGRYESIMCLEAGTSITEEQFNSLGFEYDSSN